MTTAKTAIEIAMERTEPETIIGVIGSTRYHGHHLCGFEHELLIKTSLGNFLTSHHEIVELPEIKTSASEEWTGLKVEITYIHDLSNRLLVRVS